MPQLKKVALAMGNNLVYADTYAQALAQLAGEKLPTTTEQAPATPAPTTTTSAQPSIRPNPTRASPKSASISSVIANWCRKGKLSEAGKELEAIQGAGTEIAIL